MQENGQQDLEPSVMALAVVYALSLLLLFVLLAA